MNEPAAGGESAREPRLFLVTTTQRCGSTWLTRILEGMTGTVCRYVDGRALGFRIHRESEARAPAVLAAGLRAMAPVEVFKTHDVPSREFDRLCAVLPELRVLTVSRDFKDVLVSRYFYYRYYWPDDPTLGALPAHLAGLFDSMDGLSDREALPLLLASATLLGWAGEWAAFEGPFATGHALRVGYEGLLDGSAREAIEAFTGHRMPQVASFAERQRAETIDTGRRGRSRFNRCGRSGQWREWFTEEQASRLDALVSSDAGTTAQPVSRP